MNDRVELPGLSGLPDAGDLALLERAALAWQLPGWAEQLRAMAAGEPGWLPPGRPRFAVGAAEAVATRVGRRLSLSDALRDAWKLCAAAQLDPQLAAACGGALSPAWVAGALGLPLATLLTDWAQNPLRELGLWQPADALQPLALQAMRVPPGIALALWGLQPAGGATACAPPVAAGGLQGRLQALLRDTRRPLLLLWLAEPGSPAWTEAEAQHPRTRSLAAEDGLPAALGRCLIDDALPLIDGLDLGDDRAPFTPPAAWPGALLLRARRANLPLCLPPGWRLLRHPAAAPASARLAAQWREALALDAAEAGARAWSENLARQLPLPAVACQQLADDARVAAALQGRPPGEAELLAAARGRAALGVAGPLGLREPRVGLDALVLADAAQALLKTALRRQQQRPELGLRLLFAGPPGTGKTLAAEAIAAQLGRDLLQLDAGRVFSRWLGETEQRLEQAFDAAERSGALLFIDEADALFARRTEVKDAHDRYANAGTAYLLQRVERFSGLLVLATNARGALDPAFSRRFDALIPFDEPDEDARRRLWLQRLQPADCAPQAPAQAAALLARWYPLSGAQIACAQRNAIAEDGEGLEALFGAIAREFHKAGRAFPGRPS